jgi:hypothetical protein
MVGEYIRDRSLSLSVLSGLAFIGIGCATALGGASEFETDLRGTAGPPDSEPRLLVAGPAVLLHINADERRGVTVFRVSRRDGTAADCIAGPQRTGDVVEMGHGAIYVSEKESVCATVTNGASLTWHAREGAYALSAPKFEHQASLP